jgi:predicted RNA binding protein YcfA (HicA-like mRNA interferase family)
VTKLPRDISGKEIVKALQKIGFYVIRKKGSHIILRRDTPFAQTVVPNHKNLNTGTLDSILDGARLSVDELIELL